MRRGLPVRDGGPGSTSYDLIQGSGTAEFTVDDATHRVIGFSFGYPGLVVGAEFLCV